MKVECREILEHLIDDDAEGAKAHPDQRGLRLREALRSREPSLLLPRRSSGVHSPGHGGRKYSVQHRHAVAPLKKQAGKN